MLKELLLLTSIIEPGETSVTFRDGYAWHIGRDISMRLKIDCSINMVVDGITLRSVISKLKDATFTQKDNQLIIKGSGPSVKIKSITGGQEWVNKEIQTYPFKISTLHRVSKQLVPIVPTRSFSAALTTVMINMGGGRVSYTASDSFLLRQLEEEHSGNGSINLFPKHVRLFNSIDVDVKMGASYGSVKIEFDGGEILISSIDSMLDLDKLLWSKYVNSGCRINLNIERYSEFMKVFAAAEDKFINLVSREGKLFCISNDVKVEVEYEIGTTEGSIDAYFQGVLLENMCCGEDLRAIYDGTKMLRCMKEGDKRALASTLMPKG